MLLLLIGKVIKTITLFKSITYGQIFSFIAIPNQGAPQGVPGVTIPQNAPQEAAPATGTTSFSAETPQANNAPPQSAPPPPQPAAPEAAAQETPAAQPMEVDNADKEKESKDGEDKPAA